MSLTIFGMCMIKHVDVLEGIKDYFITPDEEQESKSYVTFMKTYHWLFLKQLSDIRRKCYMVAKINDNGDICI